MNRRYETSGQAPLHIAASNGAINAIGALVAAGARLEVDTLIIIILIFISNIIIIFILFLMKMMIRRLIVCARQLYITAWQLRVALRQLKLL